MSGKDRREGQSRGDPNHDPDAEQPHLEAGPPEPDEAGSHGPEHEADKPRGVLEPPSESGLSRRSFLRVAAWSAVGLLGSRLGGAERAIAADPNNIIITQPLPVPSYVSYLRRRNDLLDLRLEFYNLGRFMNIDTGESWLARSNPNLPAYMVVFFPPQAVAERTFSVEPFENTIAPLPPLSWSGAGESRLAFEIPAEMETIPYTTESLLSWDSFIPRLVPAALPAGASPSPYPGVRAPSATETSIEMPWRLMLSPHQNLGWAHAKGLVTRNGRTEIWHTRLGVRTGAQVDEWSTNNRTVRAIWTREKTNPLHPALPLSSQSTLTVADRLQIVEATSDHTKVTSGTPKPVEVNRLMLTPLGGWLDVVGSWDNYSGDLIAWRHLATMGRDQYVRVVHRGYLFPFGHAAARITVSERRFEPHNGQTGAFLRQENFIVVRQPTKRYPGAVGLPFGGRAWPFPSLTFTTLTTPPLEFQNFGAGQLPRRDGQPFLFHITGKDAEGRDVNFRTPVVFVPASVAFNSASMSELVDLYNAQDLGGALRNREMAGQKVAVAEPDEPGDTAIDMTGLVLGANSPVQGASQQQLVGAEQPRFFPALTEFRARLSAAAKTSGNDGAGSKRFSLGPYIEHGFGNQNPGGVFAVILDAAEDVGFGADKAGGLVTPSLDVRSLTRLLGAVGGDPAKIQLADFDPTDFFKAGVAKLLGGIDLANIIQAANFALPGNSKKAMKISTRPIFDPNLEAPIQIVTELEWEPDLKADPLNLFEPDPTNGSLKIKAKFVQDILNPDASTYEIDGDLKKFQLNLIGSASTFMYIGFNRLHFRAKSGQKTDLKPEVAEVGFTGPLEFVNRIRDFLSFGGSGPFIDLEPTGLRAGYNLPLPQIPLGALMINNIALSASLFIPWSGDPARIRFGLSSREKPFDITYSAIGGGGFFGIAFGLDGLEKFECALELGAYLSVDFGVASGSVSIAAGIYFAIEKQLIDGQDVVTVGLDAYIRFVGKVQALGLIAISLEIYLALGFQTPPPKLRGTAMAELKVKVLIIEVGVKVTVKRTLSATPNDPTFADLFDEPHWIEYAEAFA